MYHDYSKKQKKTTDEPVSVNTEEASLAWQSYHEHAIIKACVNEYTNLFANHRILAMNNGEMCSEYLQDHLNNTFKPFLIDCIRSLLIQGFVSFNIVPASQSKNKTPYPCVVEVSNTLVTIKQNKYGETSLQSTLQTTETQIPVYCSEKPKSNGMLTSLVVTAQQYVRYSRFLYTNERENLESRNHPIFIVQNKESKDDVDPFQAILQQQEGTSDTMKTDQELEKLTTILNATLKKKITSGDIKDERVSFIQCPRGSHVTQVSMPEVRSDLMIKAHEHLSMMICHAMQVPIDLLFHNLTHQTDAKIIAAERTFKQKTDVYGAHALAIAHKAFILCFAKFDEEFTVDEATLKYIY
jgi:hypothetical protein